jgi:hypothetical protein
MQRPPGDCRAPLLYERTIDVGHGHRFLGKRARRASSLGAMAFAATRGDWEAKRELADLITDSGERCLVLPSGGLDSLVDPGGDLLHLGLVHAAGRGRWGSDPQSGGIEWFAWIDGTVL